MADFKVKFDGRESPNFKAEMGEVHMVTVGAAPYEGAYTVTPTTDVQILHTSGRKLDEDVMIEPIPKEYGRVTYDNRKIIRIT